jgi:hypothetical protein
MGTNLTHFHTHLAATQLITNQLSEQALRRNLWMFRQNKIGREGARRMDASEPT